jgi:hypothetical protein
MDSKSEEIIKTIIDTTVNIKNILSTSDFPQLIHLESTKSLKQSLNILTNIEFNLKEQAKENRNQECSMKTAALKRKSSDLDEDQLLVSMANSIENPPKTILGCQKSEINVTKDCEDVDFDDDDDENDSMYLDEINKIESSYLKTPSKVE